MLNLVPSGFNIGDLSDYGIIRGKAKLSLCLLYAKKLKCKKPRMWTPQ